MHALKVGQAEHESVLALKKNIEKQFGRLDVFVNNAVARPMQRYIDPLECWTESMRINATGMFDVLREMADLIAKSNGGSIVNISSMQGVFGPDFSLYESTDMDSPPDYHFHKGGMIALTHYLARNLATNHPIRILFVGIIPYSPPYRVVFCFSLEIFLYQDFVSFSDNLLA